MGKPFLGPSYDLAKRITELEKQVRALASRDITAAESESDEEE